jgi:hypothetical protein
VRLPESITDRLPFLEAFDEDWEKISKPALMAWTAFYALFLYDALRGRGFLLLIDLVFVPIHEGGHLLFGYFGETLHVAGGTLLQLFVPFALAFYFALRRQPAGTAFCAFFFFEQFFPVSRYMADARAQELPLVTIGDPELAQHDWFALFSKFGVLEHDTQIASVVRGIGWLGMLATLAWLLRRGLADGAVRTEDVPPIA